MLDTLSRAREGRSRRISSWDTSGRNRDAWPVPAGETSTLAAIPGAGIIRHIWFTVSAPDPLYLRRCVVRIFWDGEDSPSVEAPVGDFFGVGHAKVASFSCAAMNMSANEGDERHAAMNCYWPMPFANGARVTVENQAAGTEGVDEAVRSWYFYVDYDQLDRLPDDQLRFHAWWRRENPCRAPRQQSDDWQVNLSDEDNYLFVETEGRGHFCGANLSVHNLCGGWWGEGDDMVMIDGQEWPPDMHGTGSEDWYNQAWGSQPHNSFPYNGVSYHHGAHNHYNERLTVYRYHIVDPILFSKSLRVSIEHGHANDRLDDYSSTAYWYQSPRTRPLAPILPVSERLPRPDATVQPVDLPVQPERRMSGSRYRVDLPR
jgi:hypothetical protein